MKTILITTLTTRRQTLQGGLAAVLAAISPRVAFTYEPPGKSQTVRLFDKRGRPQRLTLMGGSCDGRYVAVAAEECGWTIIDTHEARVAHQVDSGTFYALAFSPDSRKLAALGYYNRSSIYDLKTQTSQRITPTESHGSFGFSLDTRSGRHFVDRISVEAADRLDGRLRQGDELIAAKRGRAPTLARDRGKWITFTGRTKDAIQKDASGPPGTWMRMQVAREGEPATIEVEIQRWWGSNAQRAVTPETGHSLLITRSHRTYSFYAVPSIQPHAHVEGVNVMSPTAWALSQDGRRFALLGRMADSDSLALEVFQLDDSALLESVLVSHGACQQLLFSHDGKEVIYATRDSIERLEIDKGLWARSLPLVPDELRDPGRVVRRSVPLGFPGGLATSVNERVYSTPAPLVRCDLSKRGLLVIGSQEGELSLWDGRRGEYLLPLTDQPLAAPPEVLKFTSDGSRVIAYAKGNLSIFPVPEVPL